MKNMVDERFECISVIMRLAGNWEYCIGYSDVEYKGGTIVGNDYQKEICETFRKFEEHEAVRYAKKIGLAYDLPFHFSLHIEKKEDEFVFIDDISSLLIYVWTEDRAKKFLSLYNKFYEDTGYAEFYNARIPYFEEVTAKFIEKHYSHIDFNWFKKYVDISNLRCVVSPSNSDMNYPCMVNNKLIYCMVREDGGAIVHEYCHLFANPLGHKWYEEIPEFQKWCDDSLDQHNIPGYGSSYNMAYEYVTNAYNILYDTQSKDKRGTVIDGITYTTAEYVPVSVMNHKYRGFPYLGEVYKMILDLDKGRQPKKDENTPDLSNTKKYYKTRLEDCGNMTIGNNIVRFGDYNSWFNIKNIDGGKGGRAVVYIHYKPGAVNSKFNLAVNDKDYVLLNQMGFNNYVFTEVILNAGENNLITLSKPQNFHGMNINYIAVKLLDD